MPSGALINWQSDRWQRLQNLIDVHAILDRREHWAMSEQVTWALVLLLGAEFQGYCRELHDQAGVVLAKATAGNNAKLREILLDRLTHHRMLDRGNAHPGNLGTDYGMLGIELWPLLHQHGLANAQSWRSVLTDLNDARNAIAHSHTGRVSALRLQLGVVSAWRNTLDDLATAMDNIVESHLMHMFGLTSLWRQGDQL